jgi:DNA-binding CsgD family transcriptional regulator/tetratricopeptide (TPR) repeat protein
VANAQRTRAFIGRGAELARLHAAFDAVLVDRLAPAGRTVIVAGEAGIGKTRLVEQFTADASARVLTGACLEVAEDALPYAPFVEVLRAIVRETSPERLPAVLGPGRAELSRLLPELAARAADLQPEPQADRASQARLFELVLGAVERLAADRPLLLVIDDVQWADRSTRDLIGFLARALRDDAVLLLLTIRTDAAGEPVGNLAFLAELEREEHVDRLDLPPFDRDEVAELLASLLADAPEPAVVDRLVARTDGNPFYVEELVRAGAGRAARGAQDGPLPPVLRDVLAVRVGALSPAARSILRAAAVAGRRIDDELLSAALRVAPPELSTSLREAVASDILARVASHDGLASQFRHALLQEVVLDELFPAERVLLHERFAEALEARLLSGDGSVAPVEVARHWDGAREAGRALPFMVQAAQAAEAVYAFAEALTLWERAATILEDLAAGGSVEGMDLPALLDRAASSAALVGRHRDAADAVQRALLHLYPAGSEDRILALENRLRWHLWWAGERAATTAAIDAAVTALAAGPRIAYARALAQQSAVRMLSGDLEGSAASAREAIGIGERAGAVVEIALAHGVLGWDTAMLGDVDAGIAGFRRGQAIAEATGSVEGMAIAATNLAGLLDRVGRAEAALDVALAGYAMTERYGVARTFGGTLLGHAAKAQLALGRWDDAERSTEMGLRRGAIDDGALWLNLNRARLLALRGRFDDASELLQRARAIEARLGGTDHANALLAAEAEVAAWAGQPSIVLDRAEEGLELEASLPAPDPSLAWLAALALRAVADSAGSARDPRALVVVARIKAILGKVVDRPGFAVGGRATALLAQLRAETSRVDGLPDAAAWREVRELWATLGRPFAVAYAGLREAEALVAGRGSREDAASALADAARTAARLRAGPLLGLVADFAGRARLPLPPDLEAMAPGGGAAAPVFDLTEREAEVLRLVAAGWTNQQIADSLFITRKTASVHVSNAMGKLGAANRGEAAALAHRLGLAGEEPLPVGR